eukprot:scaffold118045_cov66-Phaeocystis_antarctica.AAC.1
MFSLHVFGGGDGGGSEGGGGNGGGGDGGGGEGGGGEGGGIVGGGGWLGLGLGVVCGDAHPRAREGDGEVVEVIANPMSVHEVAHLVAELAAEEVHGDDGLDEDDHEHDDGHGEDGLDAFDGAADDAPHRLEVGRELEEPEDPQRTQRVEDVSSLEAGDGGEELEDRAEYDEEVQHVEAVGEVLGQAECAHLEEHLYEEEEGEEPLDVVERRLERDVLAVGRVARPLRSLLRVKARGRVRGQGLGVRVRGQGLGSVVR